MSDLSQKIRVAPFAPRLAEYLGLVAPPFVGRDRAFFQLDYIGEFLGALGCRSMLLEEHYIDRHYMEEHSVFYSRSLYPYSNFCRRLHFFSCEEAILEESLRELRQGLRHGGEDRYRAECESFSDQSYLGFSVIKPLPGSPVGRTVLRCSGGAIAPGLLRSFPCATWSRVHVAGVELRVRGLAFQQQDLGVSACATTALWSSLQKLRDFEDFAAATPAQITLLASQHNLPFGRAMPSEGLSIEQMCLAVHAFGLSPNLFRAEDFETARDAIYTATCSGVAPILVIEDPGSDTGHAVTVVGMDLRTPHQPALVADGIADDRAGDLLAVHVHDDRIGPYLRAELVASEGQPFLDFRFRLGGQEHVERWQLCYVLAPMHTKIRLSFGGLRRIALRLAEWIQAYWEILFALQPESAEERPPVSFGSWISPSSSYGRSLLADPQVEIQTVESLWRSIPLPRYVGVIRLESPSLGAIDFVLDCTSTERNLNVLCVLDLRGKEVESSSLARQLAQWYGCRYIGPEPAPQGPPLP